MPVMRVLPAVVLVTVPTIAALVFTVLESVRGSAGVDVYRQLVFAEGQAGEFWRSVLFSLFVGLVSTALAGALSFLLVSWWAQQAVVRRGQRTFRSLRPSRFGSSADVAADPRPSLWVYSLVVSVPHLAWASALFLWLSQSGAIARIAFAVGAIDQPADFPALVADQSGLGLIAHYVTKETPFIVLAAVASLSGQQRGFSSVAAGLGAGPLARARFVTWPAVRPAIAGAMLISFSFVLHSVEAPLVLGASQPRMMSVVAAELFSQPTIDRRATAAAIGTILAVTTAALGGTGALLLRRRK